MSTDVLIKREITLEGLNCAHCAEVINEKVNKLEEIESANLNFINKVLTLNIISSFNQDEVINKVIKIIDDTEPGLNIKVKEPKMKSKKKELVLNGLNCAHCAEVICEKVNKLSEIENANLNFINKVLTVNLVSGANSKDTIDKVIKIIDDTEPGLDIEFRENKSSNDKKEIKTEDNDKKELIKLIIGTLVYLFGIYETFTGIKSSMNTIVFIVAYIVVGGDVLLKAIKNIGKGQIFDENFLMSIATIGALSIGESAEAVGVMLFYKIGEFLQGKAVGKSRQSISELMEIRPDYANLKLGSEIKEVSPYDVEVGDIIIVKPGEKVPLDGTVIDGSSMVDTSALTGESLLREVVAGEDVLSGFINKNAVLTIKVQKEFEESTASKILDLVENASSKKSKTENFITRFSKYYTPIVVVAALLIALVPPIFIPGENFSNWFYRGLVFLVVSCPCALVLSIPLSFFSGIGHASRQGILIKGSSYLEALRSVDTVVFDKTGTLTKGVFDVTCVKPVGISEDELLRYASIAEINSNHPIAKSIVKHYKGNVDLDKIKNYEEIAAHGIRVDYEGEHILAGNEKLMMTQNIFFSKANEVGTVVYIAVNKKYRGYIVISDKIKEDSKACIEGLKNIGIKQTVMLTGDNQAVANDIAGKLNLDKVYANLLPTDKVNKLEQLYEGKSDKEKIAFVGDGINDAPVLARADVGIAMGGLGSDAAIEAADVVLMTDEPSNIVKAIEIAKKTNKIVWQNIVFALGIKVIVLVLGAGGIANMWEAIFADVGVALIAVLNAMRVMK
ncbi:MAG: heavy metal translocating P-type ATPase [Paeniclostridium sordellii]|uniref:Cd(2+)-exporting ATPase n=1 Tax=Paeniclostridium hominis TaxID=2764329 RepID=A0ABR7K5X6_9FIRM|nr:MULTISPECIES: heavy metal translocating P-type ATPase [Paeniclostridium]MBC6004511.1 cadmium-translocating P-type ATPase [Paeniclostridium hominis]MDU2591410.1 heavy metal translocating P-type ATPase [Paeniclostridium sordellii]